VGQRAAHSALTGSRKYGAWVHKSADDRAVRDSPSGSTLPIVWSSSGVSTGGRTGESSTGCWRKPASSSVSGVHSDVAGGLSVQLHFDRAPGLCLMSILRASPPPHTPVVFTAHGFARLHRHRRLPPLFLLLVLRNTADLTQIEPEAVWAGRSGRPATGLAAAEF